ncbi:hypothetical protein [Photorhabdus temperata]|uniref:hypothetical protein n=1 Tax=Photorhabdus temperata TaxID=574560 RepID=UPI000A4B4E85|nr:hypothetical protein [Photorhabdus temperata]
MRSKKETREEEDALEFQFFSEILSGLLGNLQSSLLGQQVLAKLAAKESDSNGDGNFWRTITGSVITVLNNDKVKSPIIHGENDGNCRLLCPTEITTDLFSFYQCRWVDCFPPGSFNYPVF